MSSSEQEQIRSVAERVARRLAGASAGGAEAAGAGGGEDVSALRASLDELRRRLAHVESHLAHDEECETQGAREGARDEGAGRRATQARSTWLSGTYVPATSHPSEERFGISEAVSELVDYFEREKVCNVEPGEKPCDHCAMCSSRGF